ncbi:MAG: copper resistance protein B [Blastomonas sp.]
MKMACLAAATALAMVWSAPALAQEMDHSMHQGHASHGQAETAEIPADDEHSAHGAPTAHGDHATHQPPPEPDPHAGHAGHSGHVMPEQQGGHDAHAGHDMASHGGGGADDPPERPVDPVALSGPAHAADLFHDPAEMERVRTAVIREHGEMRVARLMVDRLEFHGGNGPDGYAWDANGWIGGDIDKLWFRTEGEGPFGENPEQAEVQALWSHAIDPWFDVQLGLRQDFEPHPQRTHAVVAVQGLAPYWFELSAAAFLSDKGDVTLRGEAEYDLRITRHVTLQPRVELNFSAQNVPEIGLGSGLTDAEAGLRLHYALTPRLAPYIGAQWEGSFGATRRYAKADGEDPSRLALVLGLRFWF